MFSICRLPRINFGAGAISALPALAAGYGRRMLLVTGASSFQDSAGWESLSAALSGAGVTWEHVRVHDEPSPQLVDDTVAALAGSQVDVVVGVGGGSALDAAKAIAGLLRVQRPISDFLEGVGPELPYPGPAVPFIAVPTTAGTGSEATRNAVLSVRGESGFKKSFRDEKLVAEYAVVDPDLLSTCPPRVIAANGMDALTQLIESYVSTRSNAFTDTLCLSGLVATRDGLLRLYEHNDEEARERMAYASLLSGICLAQTGLGSVHGLASPLGAYYPIPHGVVCGTLVAVATEINLQAMSEREPDNPALRKYRRVGETLCRQHFPDAEIAHRALVKLLNNWIRKMRFPGLLAFGVDEAGLDKVVAHSRGSSMRTNPVELTDSELRAVLAARL